MKRAILITGLAFFILYSISQDFECVKTDTAYYFTNADISFTGGQQYKALRIDSVETIETSAFYYNFMTIGSENDIWDCLSGAWPSWIGNPIEVLEDGTTIFYNYENKPITVKPQYETGQSWVCYEFYTGYFFRAYIDSMEEMTFLGMTDTVKKITFQLMDSLGNLYEHPVNYMYILLSKHHGLIRTLNFKVFPDLFDELWDEECQEYVLCGISEPENSIQNLTIERIFDFEVGDELHTHQFTHTWSEEFDFKTIQLVIAKQLIDDTLTKYTFKRCSRRYHNDYFEVYDTTYFLNDTTTQTVNLNSLADWGLNELPEKYIKSGDSNYYQYQWFNQSFIANYNKIGKTLQDGFYSDPPHDCIYPFVVDKKYYSNHKYLEGLGGPYYEYGDFGNVYLMELVYYKKGNEEWGQPYDCDSLLDGTHEVTFAESNFTIAPNPMKDFTRICVATAGQQNVKIILYNIMGKIVREEFTSGLILRKGELQPGIYLIRAFESDKLIGTKKLIVE